eukprot:TRINITY_DN6143_c0_g1_i2.p1 TRINITY_DN6143_c0_g1~~TRINITY_DN6143_c0_g1_i2.p1  ORF type:complete len:671 (-),score=160.81 TRINITY_DN6143_c0_g1_i2:42-2054(-)
MSGSNLLSVSGSLIGTGSILSSSINITGPINVSGNVQIGNNININSSIFTANSVTITSSLFNLNSFLNINGNFSTSNTNILSSQLFQMVGSLFVNNNETVILGQFNSSGGSLSVGAGTFSLVGNLYNSGSFCFNEVGSSNSLFQSNGTLVLNSGSLTMSQKIFNVSGSLSSSRELLISDISNRAALSSYGSFSTTGSTSLSNGNMVMSGIYSVDSGLLLSSRKPIILKTTNFTGTGNIVSQGYFVWSLNGDVSFQPNFMMGTGVDSFINRGTNIALSLRSLLTSSSIQAFIGTNGLTKLIFNSNVFVEGSPFSFKDSQVSFLQNVFFKKSIFSIVNTNVNSDANILFNQSSFMPLLDTKVPTTFNVQSVTWLDSNGVNNNESDNYFASSSLFSILSPNQTLQKSLSYSVMKYNTAQNMPIIRQTAGKYNILSTSSSSEISISMNTCSSGNTDGACSCKSTSAPLGAYICNNGIWKDSGLTPPVLSSNSKIQDLVQINTLYIADSNHVLKVSIDDNNFLKSVSASSGVPVIQISSFALLEGNLVIELNDKLNFNFLNRRSSNSSDSNSTITVMSYNSTNGTSFNNIQVVSQKGCTYASSSQMNQNTLSVTFAINSKTCKSTLSNGAIIGIVLGSFFGMVLIIGTIVGIIKYMNYREANQHAHDLNNKNMGF